MNALYLIGFVQSVFFLILVLTKKKIQLKDYILASYILILGFNLLFMYWLETGFHNQHPAIIILDFAYWTLLGPLLYLYIDVTTSNRPKLKWKQLIHLFPLVFILIAFSGYFFNGLDKSFFEYRSNSPLFILGYLVWMYNSPIYYIILIFKLRSHQKRIKTYYATPKDVDLKWLKYLVHGFAVFLVFLLGKGIIGRIFNVEIKIDSYDISWLVMVIYIFGIGFFGYKQRGIFSDYYPPKTKEVESDEELALTEKDQYQKSGLKDEEALIIQEKLETIMRRDKPYLEYDITLPKLAELLNTTPHKLSQVINEKYHLNFFEYINQYRLSDIKLLLKTPENADIKIMALAYDCGFNSKSAFYNFFKKETSLTPKEYRAKHIVLVDA